MKNMYKRCYARRVDFTILRFAKNFQANDRLCETAREIRERTDPCFTLEGVENALGKELMKIHSPQ